MQPPHHRPGNWRHKFIAAALLLLVFLVFLFLSKLRPQSNLASKHNSPHENATTEELKQDSAIIQGARLHLGSNQPRTPAQIVADKVISFGASRRKVVHDIAGHYGESIPEEIQQFFDAVEAGNWPETDRLFQLMAKRSGQYDNSPPGDPALNHFWPAVLETYGVAEQAQKVPAEELLKFGEDILSQLKPGAVYIGGTDSGRFIPTLLAETTSGANGERPIVLTQNALIDDRYLEYIQFLYGDRLELPTAQDAKRILAEFKAEALKRLEHDEQNPNDPKQVRHLETVKRNGEEIEVGGSTAVMDLNQRLLKLILEKNSDRGFILQESFPLNDTYAEATPAGPVMELRARADTEPLTAETASSALDYWRTFASDLQSTTPSEETLKNYSHMAVAHGNLLAHNGHPQAAEQTYQISLQIFPRNIDTLINYRRFLLDQGRSAEAATLVQTFRTRHPGLQPQLTKWLPPNP